MKQFTSSERHSGIKKQIESLFFMEEGPKGNEWMIDWGRKQWMNLMELVESNEFMRHDESNQWTVRQGGNSAAVSERNGIQSNEGCWKQSFDGWNVFLSSLPQQLIYWLLWVMGRRPLCRTTTQFKEFHSFPFGWFARSFFNWRED